MVAAAHTPPIPASAVAPALWAGDATMARQEPWPTQRMRAVVHDRYGPPDVLRLEHVERPIPKDDEVMIRVRATTVNRTDCHSRGGEPPSPDS